MPGFIPGIHWGFTAQSSLDGRDKPGHDEKKLSFLSPGCAAALDSPHLVR
jgi:hypothetical protein